MCVTHGEIVEKCCSRNFFYTGSGQARGIDVLAAFPRGGSRRSLTPGYIPYTPPACKRSPKGFVAPRQGCEDYCRLKDFVLETPELLLRVTSTVPLRLPPTILNGTWSTLRLP
jgi:hypothetical protein